MKIKTEVLKELVSKVSVGVGGNKFIPITELISIKTNAGGIQLSATDATNYLFVESGDYNGESFEATVYAEQFIKLVGKITSEDTTLNIVDGNFVVRTNNGTYTIELPLDENGEPIKYPDPRESVDDSKLSKIQLDTVDKIIRLAKPALATTLERPVLTNYYVGESVFATDGSIVTEYKESLVEKPVLMSARLMDIIGSFTGDTVDVFIGDGFIEAYCNGTEVYSKLGDSADEYATESVKKFVATEFDNWCKVRKADLLSALDRIALFVSKYDNQAIHLTFDRSNIIVANVKAGSEEIVEYTERKVNKGAKKFDPFDVYINVQMLAEQLKAYDGEVVTINYGTDFAISLTSDTTTQIVSLMEV